MGVGSVYDAEGAGVVLAERGRAGQAGDDGVAVPPGAPGEAPGGAGAGDCAGDGGHAGDEDEEVATLRACKVCGLLVERETGECTGLRSGVCRYWFGDSHCMEHHLVIDGFVMRDGKLECEHVDEDSGEDMAERMGGVLVEPS